jgi:Spy/CpxP family protein refolding chaperone
MCHSARREQRQAEHLSFFPDHDWLEQLERYRRSARHERRARRRCVFMPHHDHRHHDADSFEGRSAFGVRRPLRFLAHKLDLDDKQITALVRILDNVKTERAQAEVDDRRALAEYADAVAGEVFDTATAAKAGERRVQSAAKLRETLAHALEEIHAMLTPEQRQRLAYLIRSGVLSV